MSAEDKKKSLLKDLFKGTTLDGFLEAARTRPLTEFIEATRIPQLRIDKTYALKKPHTFISQRTGDARLFSEKNIQLQIEGQRDNQVTVRGKYPNDEYFATVPAEDLEEHHSSPEAWK